MGSIDDAARKFQGIRRALWNRADCSRQHGNEWDRTGKANDGTTFDFYMGNSINQFQSTW